MKRSDNKSISDVTRIFKTLSDPNRIRVIQMLHHRNLCVCEITDILGLAASTVSKHLSILKDAGMIIDEKEGKWVNYRLVSFPENEYVQHLQFLLKNWLRDSKQVQQDRQMAKQSDRRLLCSNSI